VLHTIRRAAGIALTAALLIAPLQSNAAFSGLYIFGDSLSDPGNAAVLLGPTRTPASAITSNLFIPAAPYVNPTGRDQFSNGNVWSYSFAQSLGLTANPVFPFAPGPSGTSYAIGGATTGTGPTDLQSQLGIFLSTLGGGTAPGGALYVIAGGGNDARAALGSIAANPSNALAIIADASTAYATNVKTMVDTLQARGAQSIIVWNTPNVGLAPATLSLPAPPPGFPTASQTATLLTSSMNQALSSALTGENGVTTFDIFGLITKVNANPNAYGLTNAVDACGAVANCDPSKYLFWDGIHPTAAGHLILADGMLATIPEPGTVLLLSLGFAVLLVATRRRQA
jgi:phospholipase/lecithinase/hemolysin